MPASTAAAPARMCQLDAEEDRGERHAERAGEHRAHAEQRQRACDSGEDASSARPVRRVAPPIISSGASTPPEVPEPSENAHISDLQIRMPQ